MTEILDKAAHIEHISWLGELSHLFKMKLDPLRPVVVGPVLGSRHLTDVPQVQAVERILAVPLEPHDQGHGPLRAGGGVAGQRDGPTNVAEHLQPCL